MTALKPLSGANRPPAETKHQAHPVASLPVPDRLLLMLAVALPSRYHAPQFSSSNSVG